MRQEIKYKPPHVYLLLAIAALAATIGCVVLAVTLEHEAWAKIFATAVFLGILVTGVCFTDFRKSLKQRE